jgi:CheY-like chemotaxis protein
MTHLITHFLLADDDEDDVYLFCEAVAELGPAMKCDTAENGEAVFDILSQQSAEKPEIIFLDINMPVMNGWECLSRLKEDPASRHIPVIMYSTSAAEQDVDRAYSLGALTFLTKPEDHRELAQILEIVARNPQDLLLSLLTPFKSVRLKRLV